MNVIGSRVRGAATHFFLRIFRPAWRTRTDIESEVVWLRALVRDTEMPVPAGYGRIALWPYGNRAEIDTLRAGRMIWVANYIARYEAKNLAQHIEHVTPMFCRFLDTGRIRKVAE